MTVNVDQRPGEQTGPPDRRPGRRGLLAFAAIAPIVLVLVVAAGFTHPWNSGNGLLAGTYTRDYAVSQQVQAPDVGRCLEVTLKGTMSATYNAPAWSLGGPGWTSTRLADTSIELRTMDVCGEGAVAAPVDGAQLSQFWVTQTCAEPARGEWQESIGVGRCDQDLAVGVSGAEHGAGSAFTSAFSGLGAQTWHGTVYGDSVCLEGRAGLSVTVGSTVLGTSADDLRVCLDPETAEPA